MKQYKEDDAGSEAQDAGWFNKNMILMCMKFVLIFNTMILHNKSV